MDRPDLSALRDSYRRTFAEHGDSPAAVQWPKGRQELRWAALTGHLPPGTRGRFLDFGCGLGHFKGFVDKHFPGSSYSGADVVPEFIDHACQVHPGAEWQLLTRLEDLRGEFDYIVLSGVFNRLYFADPEQHQLYLEHVLGFLFARARISLSIDFMSDRVDFVQAGAFHQNVDRIRAFAQRALSARLRIDESYMPYEFALTVFRDAQILRPDNVYRQ